MKRKAVVILIFILMFSSLIVGCQTKPEGKDTSEPNDTSEPIATQEPIKDSLVVAYNSTTESLDPFLQTSTNAKEVMVQIYDTLFSYNRNNELVPSLANDYIVSDDGREYSVSLKKGVMFSNGKEMNANDVKFSYEYAMASPAYASIVNMIDKVEVIDDYDVKIVLKDPYGPFNVIMSQIFILNKEVVESVELYGELKDYVGTGAFSPTVLQKGQRVEFIRNENYFGEKPQINKLTFVVIQDDSTATIALEKKEIDMIRYLDPTYVDVYEKNNDIDVYQFQTSEVEFLHMNCSVYPLDNPDFRRAIAYAFDREGANIVQTNGKSETYDTYLTPGTTGFAPDIKAPSQDIEKAKEFLKKSGVPEGTELKYMLLGGRKWGEVLQKNLSDIGIQLDLANAEHNAGISNLFSGDFMITGMNATNRINDGDFLYIWYSMESSTGFTHYKNEAYDNLLIEARRITDKERRVELYRKAQEILRDEAVMIPIYNRTAYVGHLKGLKVTHRPDLHLEFKNITW